MQDVCFQLSMMPNCDGLAQSVADYLHCDAAMVCVASDEDYVAVGCSEFPPSQPRVFPRDDLLITNTLYARTLVRVTDMAAEPGLRTAGSTRDLDVKAYLGVPLQRSDGDVVGTLSAISHSPRIWRDSDTHCLLTMAELLQTRIDRHLLQLELDSLCGALAENDAALVALAGVGDKALTVQNAAGELIFVHRAVQAELGLSDRDIWDVINVAAFFNMSNRVASATAMEPNPEYHAQAR